MTVVCMDSAFVASLVVVFTMVDVVFKIGLLVVIFVVVLRVGWGLVELVVKSS